MINQTNKIIKQQIKNNNNNRRNDQKKRNQRNWILRPLRKIQYWKMII